MFQQRMNVEANPCQTRAIDICRRGTFIKTHCQTQIQTQTHYQTHRLSDTLSDTLTVRHTHCQTNCQTQTHCQAETNSRKSLQPITSSPLWATSSSTFLLSVNLKVRDSVFWTLAFESRCGKLTIWENKHHWQTLNLWPPDTGHWANTVWQNIVNSWLIWEHSVAFLHLDHVAGKVTNWEKGASKANTG